MTEDAEYRFTIKESGTGVPWIMCEIVDGSGDFMVIKTI
jgi:hypothetical protein